MTVASLAWQWHVLQECVPLARSESSVWLLSHWLCSTGQLSSSLVLRARRSLSAQIFCSHWPSSPRTVSTALLCCLDGRMHSSPIVQHSDVEFHLWSCWSNCWHTWPGDAAVACHSCSHISPPLRFEKMPAYANAPFALAAFFHLSFASLQAYHVDWYNISITTASHSDVSLWFSLWQ